VARPNAPLIPDVHCVGWISDAHGLKGELYVRLYADQSDWLNELDSFYLLSQKTPAPENINEFKVKVKKPHKKGLIIGTPQIQDRTAAENMIGHWFYISEEILISEDDSSEFYLKEIMGFEVRDQQLGVVGKVHGFSSNGEQDLLVLKHNGKEVLIPLIEEFVIEIDFDRGLIEMDLPEGLLDL
jgi:16S rRNA processing protein RimM